GTARRVSVTKAAFEQATADLVGQCVDTARRLIATAGQLGAAPVARVLLVGGSTRMPMIAAALQAGLGLPTLVHDPDRAVARGAAVLAAQLVAGSQGDASRFPRGITQRIGVVLPRAIGIKVYSSGLPLRPDPYVLNLI